MGVFDFIKTKQTPKQSSGSGSNLSSSGNSRGTVTVDKFTFNVRDYSLKGFILFKCSVNLSKDGHSYEGRAEAMVTKITSGALAATFTIKPAAN